MKKLINEPSDVVDEMLEGMVRAHPGQIDRLDGTDVIVRAGGPKPGAVGVVTGGGSGHEPMHAGFVGPGMLTAAAAGQIFTSPPATDLRDMLEAADAGEGVLAVIKNYEGDLMNFDTAADLADVEYESVIVDDDIAISEAEDRTGRRGVAGTVFVHKVAGARADQGASLDAVAETARKAIENLATMGVSLTSCITPEKGAPTVDLADDEMEYGIGIHGEPGVERTGVQSADTIADRLTTAVIEDLDLGADDEVVVMVNGLGGTPLSECYIVHREVASILEANDVRLLDSWVGEYCTSLDMAGCSVTALRLDDELKGLMQHPVETLGLTIAD